MQFKAWRLIGVALIPCLAATLNAAQRDGLRELVRTRGDIHRVMFSCGPPTGLKEVVGLTQLTIEGVITRADSALLEDARNEYVYTDFVIDVTRVFRLPTDSVSRATPGATQASPFIADPPPNRPTAIPLRVGLPEPYPG